MTCDKEENKTRAFKLGLIGCGHMGMAIIRGAVAREFLRPDAICVFDRKEEVRKACENEGFHAFDTMQEAAASCDITLLAVTPQAIDEVLPLLKKASVKCLLSIVTGVSIAYFQEKLGASVPVIRVMPNTPLQIGCGATALCRSQNCSDADYDFIFRCFGSMGIARTIPEDQMNDIITVHGSTPAYFYYYVQCLLEDAVSRGIDEESARALLVQTMIGSGLLLQQKADRPISELVDEVCSKGGTTIEAVKVLKERDLSGILHEADEKCIHRACQLGR